MMRILYLHQYFRTPDMPGGTRSYEMARRLVAAGHDVDMVTADCEGDRKFGEFRQSEVAGINVHSVAVPYSNFMSYPNRIKSFLQFSWYATRKALSLPADIVFATSTPLTIAIPGFCAARYHQIPMVFEVRDLWPEVPIAMGAIRNPVFKFATRRLEQWAYRSSEHIVALAPGMKDDVVATGYPADKVTVIPNGCDVELFHIDPERGRALRNAHPWLGDRPFVIYTGSLGLAHGVDYLVRLAAAVRPLDPEVRILVMGEGSQKENLRNLAQSLGVLGENFFLMDAIAKESIPEWLEAADFVCSVICDQPALYKDAVTNKFFDGLAAGKPILNNFFGWQSQICIEEDIGIIVDRHDLERAASSLVNALRNEAWRIEAGKRARQLALTRFNRDNLANQLDTILRNSAAQSGSILQKAN